jgi:hypothetical protein
MRDVTLVFPDSNLLAAFVLMEAIKGLDVKSCELKVSGQLTAQQITTACTTYRATVQKMKQSFPKGG